MRDPFQKTEELYNTKDLYDCIVEKVVATTTLNCEFKGCPETITFDGRYDDLKGRRYDDYCASGWDVFWLQRTNEFWCRCPKHKVLYREGKYERKQWQGYEPRIFERMDRITE